MIEILEAKILASSRLGQDLYLLSLDAPTVARSAQPGQFVHIRCSETFDPLLRRPLSIHDIGRDGELVLLYRVKGRGTAWLAGQQAGSKINLLGPVGKGFSVAENQKVVLVAGGLGIIPLLFLARRLLQLNNEVDFFMGAHSREELLRLDVLQSMEMNLFLATDDGSAGVKGLVTGLLEKKLRSGVYDRGYSCGPKAAMAEFARLTARAGLPAEVSLEERMACGLGFCRGCVTAVRDIGGNKQYENVCSCGPVFNTASVCWGE